MGSSGCSACRKLTMIQWISVCMLVVLHCVVLLQQCICAVYKQLLPSFAAKANRPRGIRPAAPKCIALALNESVQETQQLGLVLQWCGKVGLQHAIVYAGEGGIQQHTDKLGLSRSCKDGGAHSFQMGGCSDLTVHLLSHKEFTSPLVSLVTDHEPASYDGSLQTEGGQAITAAWLDKQLQQTESTNPALLEPELMLVFGNTFTLGGYPPWPIRVTEMYHMGRLQDASSTSLQATLQQYCRTLQRFGT